MRVLVVNHCAHNKGDAAVLYFVLRELARHGVTEVTISASDPRFCPKDHPGLGLRTSYVPYGWNVEGYDRVRWLERFVRQQRDRFYRRIAYPVARYLVRGSHRLLWPELLADWRFARALRRADVVISTGGHHLTTLLVPDAVYPQTFDLGVVAAARKPFSLWSQSLGPFLFARDDNRELHRKILSSATCIYLREEQSRQELAALGVSSENVRVTYESVFGLHDVFGEYVAPSQRKPLLGIAVYTQQRRSAEQLSHYVNSWARLVDHAVESGWTPRLFPHEIKGSRADDRWCLRQILAASRHGTSCQLMDEDMDTTHHLSKVQECRVFVGHKTHSVIFALVTCTPVLAIAYHRKFKGFMEQYGLSQYCIEDSTLSGRVLVDAFNGMSRQLDEIAHGQRETGRRLAGAVQEDFGSMLDALRARASGT